MGTSSSCGVGGPSGNIFLWLLPSLCLLLMTLHRSVSLSLSPRSLSHPLEESPRSPWVEGDGGGSIDPNNIQQRSLSRTRGLESTMAGNGTRK